MKRTIQLTSAVAILVGLFAIAANAQQQTAPVQETQRMSVSQLAAMLEGQGYSILEIDLERGRYDVDMIDSNGMKVEAYFDAVTGAQLPYRESRYGRDWDGDDRWDD